MDDFEPYAPKLEGRILTNLYFTEQDGPHNYRPGIAPAYYFSTIMELDGETLLRFEDDFIAEWKHESALTELTNENWALPDHIVFKGQPIAKVVRSESGQLSFHLKNGTSIAHVRGDGDQLVVEKKVV